MTTIERFSLSLTSGNEEIGSALVECAYNNGKLRTVLVDGVAFPLDLLHILLGTTTKKPTESSSRGAATGQ